MWLLAPLLVAALVLLALAGRRHERVVATNLESPRLSSGRRVIDLVRVPEPRARVFNVTLTSGAHELGDDARVRVQLATAGQTRLIVVRDGHPDGSRWATLREWLLGSARGAVVADRGWLDLGPLPRAGETRRLQVVGVLPGASSFVRLGQQPPGEQPVVVDVAGWSEAGLVREPAAVRFEVVAPEPLALTEVLARVLFFVRQSRALTAAAVLAAIAFVIGWSTLDRPRHASAAFFLVTSAVLVHAILLPPLQGADETSHVATAEGIAAKGVKYRPWWYPESIAVVATALDQDRVQHQSSEPLPLRDEAERGAVDGLLGSRLERELQRPGEPPAGAFGQPAESRAPAFYHVFRIFGAIAPQLAIADRLALYRLTSVAIGMALLGVGLAVLVVSGLGEKLAVAYCALFTFPYAVIVLASCSNYAPAIGLGGIVGAAAVAAIMAPGRRARRACRVALIVGAWLGVGLWWDFALAAIVLTVPAALGLPPFADPADAGSSASHRALPLATAAGVVLVGGVAFWARSGELASELVTRAAVVFGRSDSWIYVLAAAPLVVAVGFVLLDRRHRSRSPERRRRDAIALSITLAVAIVVLWLVVPSTRVPYEKTFLLGWEFLSTATATVLSTNLSWDQDRLTWIFVVGAGGWHDVFFPPVVYALARWLTVAAVVSLPVLSLRCRLRRPHTAAALLLLAGIGCTLMAASLAIRHASLVHPTGRFALPWLALALLPLIARARSGRDAIARALLRATVLFHLWASFVVVGLRYALGS
jgi:hypothetical protein